MVTQKKVDATRLAAIRARLQSASHHADGSQPWHESDAGDDDVLCGEVTVADVYAPADRTFIAHAPQDMRDLLAWVEAALPIVQTVAGIQEWAGDPHTPYDARISLLTITRARALLASETPEGGAGRDDGQA